MCRRGKQLRIENQTHNFLYNDFSCDYIVIVDRTENVLNAARARTDNREMSALPNSCFDKD